jgi:hypothetical protein
MVKLMVCFKEDEEPTHVAHKWGHESDGDGYDSDDSFGAFGFLPSWTMSMTAEIRSWIGAWWDRLNGLEPYDAAIRIGDRALQVAALRRDGPLTNQAGWRAAAPNEDEEVLTLKLMKKLDVSHPNDYDPLFVLRAHFHDDSAVPPEVLSLAQEAAQPWARSRHWLYPCSVRGVVALVLLTRHRLDHTFPQPPRQDPAPTPLPPPPLPHDKAGRKRWKIMRRVEERHQESVETPPLPLEMWEMILGYLRRGDCLAPSKRSVYRFYGRKRSVGSYEISSAASLLRSQLAVLECEVDEAEEQMACATEAESNPEAVIPEECYNAVPQGFASEARNRALKYYVEDSTSWLEDAVKRRDFHQVKREQSSVRWTKASEFASVQSGQSRTLGST